MGLFEWVFPITAQKQEIQKVRENMARVIEAQGKAAKKRKEQIEGVSGEHDFVALAFTALVSLLEEKGVITRQDLLARLQRLDTLDGVPDGKLTPAAVREALMGKPAEGQEAPKA